MGFELRPLEAVVEEILDRRGVTPFKLGGKFVSVGHRVISAKLIKEGRVALGADEPRYVDSVIYKKWMRSPLRQDDVIMTSEAPLGELAYLDQPQDWVLGQRLFAIRPRKDILSGKFLYYALATQGVRDSLLARASGTTVQGIRQAELRKVETPVPPLSVQIEAAEVLGALDDRIDVLRQINTTLEAIAQALFKSWFVDFDPVRTKAEGREPEAMDAATAALFPIEFEESELGPIPKGWCVLSIGDVLAEQNERVGSREIPEYSSTNFGLQPRSTQFKKGLSASISKNKVVRKGQLVFGLSRKVLNFGLMFDPIGCVSPVYKIFAVNHKISPKFLERLIRTKAEYFYSAVSASSREGQSVSSYGLSRLRFVRPGRGVLERFANITGTLASKIAIGRIQIENLGATRDTLLPRLISGKLRLPEATEATEAALA